MQASTKKDVDKSIYNPPAKSKKDGTNIVKQGTEANSANNAPASTDTNPPAAGTSSDTNKIKSRGWAPTELMAPSTNRQMHTMPLPQR